MHTPEAGALALTFVAALALVSGVGASTRPDPAADEPVAGALVVPADPAVVGTVATPSKPPAAPACPPAGGGPSQPSCASAGVVAPMSMVDPATLSVTSQSSGPVRQVPIHVPDPAVYQRAKEDGPGTVTIRPPEVPQPGQP